MMDFPDDFLSEPSVVKAPAANRFKPKAKPRLQKGPSVASKPTKELPINSVVTDSASDQACRANDFVHEELHAPKNVLFTNKETDETKDSSTHSPMILEDQLLDKNWITEDKGLMDSAEPGYPHIVVPKSGEVQNVSADTSFGLQPLENVIDQSTPAVDFPIETSTLDASSTQSADASAFANISFASASPFQPCTQTSHDVSAPSTYGDSDHYKVETVGSDAGELWINIEEGAEGFSSLENEVMTNDFGTASGKRPVKFHPKPKVQISMNRDASELASEYHYLDGDGSAYATEPHTISDFSSAQHEGNHASMHPNSVAYEDADTWMTQNLPEESGKHGKSIEPDALNSSDKSLDGSTGLLGSEANEDGYEINYDVGDEVHGDASAQPYDNSATIGGENNLGSETSKKKRTRNSKKVASEKDKSARKKRKTTKVSDQSADKPINKVPRAPRRKRCVNKTLLEAPEDEIDLQRVSIRELIILADYKERLAKKNAAVIQSASANEGTDNILSEDPPYDDDGSHLDYDQDQDSFDKPSTSATVIDTSYYNYHSFMDKRKISKMRWSKEDTELFYRGIREFGSDFLMIQKLHFPGRTRNHIKLKYKKEERENPQILHAALNSRAKDLSHFEILAQRVQNETSQIEAEENQMSGEDDPTGSPMYEEEGRDEGTFKTDEISQKDAAKFEEKQATVDEDLDMAQDASPANSNDNEDDFNWDDYKSGL